MDDKLKKVLKDNPWSTMDKKIEDALSANSQHKARLVLPEDEVIINEFEKDHSGTASELLLDLPPQPFIGNPDAKVWILQFNPGYSNPIDNFDYLDVDHLSKKDRHKNRSYSYTLSERMGLIRKQYQLENADFYALDEKFHTFKFGFRGGRGMYLWYENVLFSNDESLFHFVPKEKRKEFADRNIFVLEFFPYHSKQFGGINFFPFLPSFKFWRALVEYALANEKILICHGLSSDKSLTAAIVRSLQGYDKAKEGGWVYKVERSGKGRSSLALNKHNVVPVSTREDRLEKLFQRGF